MAANIIEISSSSDLSFEEAIRRCVMKACALGAVCRSEITEQVHVVGGGVMAYRVAMRVTLMG